MTMSWMMIVGVVVILVIVLPYVVGMMLSPSFELHVVQQYNHQAEAVWNALHDFKSIPSSGTMCKGSESINTHHGLISWRENIGSSIITIETIESVKAQDLDTGDIEQNAHDSNRTKEHEQPWRVIRRFSDSVIPLTMECEYTITKKDMGSTLSVSATGSVANGKWCVPYFRFMIKMFGGAKKGQANYLKAIAKHLNLLSPALS